MTHRSETVTTRPIADAAQHLRAYEDTLLTHYRGDKIVLSARTGEFRIGYSDAEFQAFKRQLSQNDHLVFTHIDERAFLNAAA